MERDFELTDGRVRVTAMKDGSVRVHEWDEATDRSVLVAALRPAHIEQLRVYLGFCDARKESSDV